MPLAETMFTVLWVGLTAYVLFAGADFGRGVWDLLAGGAERGRPQRTLIERSIGPVWKTNHVWLIFVIVMTWTGLPSVFAAIASTFAFSSLVTPFFLGTVAGAIASGRVPPGIAEGGMVSSWLNPTSIISGALALGTAAYLAAVYLTRDAERGGDLDLAEAFRRRALAAGTVVGVLSAAGLLVLRTDARPLFTELISGRGLPLLILSVVVGIASLLLLLLWRRAYLAVRVTAALAVTGLLWGWGLGQYPCLLPGIDVDEAAATDAVLAATLVR